MSTEATQPAADERRQYPRQAVRILVDYDTEDSFLYDYSTDLSEGGIFIATKTPLAQGESIDLRFTLPGSDHVFQLKGEVTWVHEKVEPAPETGIESLDALDDALNMLNTQSAEAAPAKGKELPTGMGVKFLNVSLEEQKTLRQFLWKTHY